MNTRTPSLVPAGTELSLKLWVVLSRAFEAVERLDRQSIAAQGLTPAEFGALEALYHKGPLLLGELQRAVLASSGGTTYLVDKLQRKGLVRRRACPGDRRAMYAELTEAGRRRIEEIFPSHARLLDEALEGLSAAEKAEAIELLKKLGYGAAEAREVESGS